MNANVPNLPNLSTPSSVRLLRRRGPGVLPAACWRWRWRWWSAGGANEKMPLPAALSISDGGGVGGKEFDTHYDRKTAQSGPKRPRNGQIDRKAEARTGGDADITDFGRGGEKVRFGRAHVENIPRTSSVSDGIPRGTTNDAGRCRQPVPADT